MASIFEIDRQLEELIDPETGELLDYDAFLKLQMETIPLVGLRN